MLMEQKHCSKCDTVKSLDEFYKATAKSDGLRTYCKSCSKIATKKVRDKNPEYNRRYWLRTNYNITLEEYNVLFESQDGRCAICGTAETASGKSFAVDHNHDTGEVRGLLCIGCNAGLGNLREDPFIFESAMVYLRSAA